MNHNGNANKMVDTPSTDSCLTAILDADGYVDQRNCPKLWVSHSRELERELNAANSRIELLMSSNADVARIAGERDAAEKRIRLLIAERDKYQDRIKRLEEAGDKMAELIDGGVFMKYAVQWYEAKEAKP